MSTEHENDPYGLRRADGTPSCNCMCRTQAEHDEGQRLQAQSRAQLRIPAQECVGCYLGDDGPSLHDYSYGCEYYAG